MLIEEVILENFMSYEYSKIPLKPGLNIVCGPNGSGKSSILLAISVAFGQAYTERSKKLSDLIRWGKESARVTLVFDNSAKNGERAVPELDSDFLRISRYLKKDGTYWFEVNFKVVNKAEIVQILSRFGINPDNMLIIMHQRMMEEFGMTTNQQRLFMVEEAVGISEFRKNVIQAQEKLTRVLSEEASISNLLENAKQTLSYWEGEYNRLKRKKGLLNKKENLERELFWAQVLKQEKMIESWKEKLSEKDENLSNMEKEIDRIKLEVVELEDNLNGLRFEEKGLFYNLLTFEKEKTEYDITQKILEDIIKKLYEYINKMNARKIDSKILNDLNSYLSELKSQSDPSIKKLNDCEKKIKEIRLELSKFDEKIGKITRDYLDSRVKHAVLLFEKERVKEELDQIKKELTLSERELEKFKYSAENYNPRIETNLSPQEILDDIKMTNAQLASLEIVSEDSERLYSSYLKIFNELNEKIKMVSENRLKALNEIEERKIVWKNLLHTLLDNVNGPYKDCLSKIGATGKVRLTDTQDIETSGLELTVGFKGAEPSILDAYTQSGGERSSATMAFLLALQQYLRSPFRAVDEFDVHMDPRNREIISQKLFDEIGKNMNIQYVTITPGQITTLNENIHVIVVQNIEGRSEIKVVV